MQCSAVRTHNVCVIITRCVCTSAGGATTHNTVLQSGRLCCALRQQERPSLSCHAWGWQGLSMCSGTRSHSLSSERKWGRKPTCKRSEACRPIIFSRHADQPTMGFEVVCCMRGRSLLRLATYASVLLPATLLQPLSRRALLKTSASAAASYRHHAGSCKAVPRSDSLGPVLVGISCPACLCCF
jgi:hypothetical protein